MVRHLDGERVPVPSTAEAWFRCMAWNRAGLDGARTVAGMATASRPCEVGDMHRIVSHVYRTDSLRPEHLAVVVRYGRTMLKPDPNRPGTSRDLLDWRAGLDCLDRAPRATQIVS
jgi:hypothetical protein